MPALDQVLDEEVARLQAAGLRRVLRRWEGRHGAWIELDGRRLSSFSSNNYLGLAGEPALVRAMVLASEGAGLGSAASRLIAGNHAEHEGLEAELADFHGTAAALLFNSGYQANLGCISALVGREDLVLSDELNHASLIDGCRLARASVEVYPHRDAGEVGRILGRCRGRFRRCLVVSDSVFSMDGDRAPLVELGEACRAHDAWLMVDDAHGVGTLGPDGQGLAAALDVRPDVLVGTFGKAFGTFGAYVAGSGALREFLLHRARSFVFTTALPPPLVAASRASLALVRGPRGTARRALLKERIEQFRSGLEELGLLVPGSGTSAIFPVLVGDDLSAVEVSSRLMDAGIHAQAIRPPTVPRGTSRLRFALMATHEPAQLEHVLAELSRLRTSGVLPRASSAP